MDKKKYIYQDICDEDIKLLEKLQLTKKPNISLPWKYYQSSFERIFGSLKDDKIGAPIINKRL